MLCSISFYKASDGMNYILSFPNEWIIDHSENKSGPYYCRNCFVNGCINYKDYRIFLGYCINCAYYKYKNKRGNGFFGNFDDYDFDEESVPDYLKGYRLAIINNYKYGMWINKK